MNWIVKLNYFDGKDMNVILPEEEVSKFLEAFKKGDEYMTPNGKGGFLTNPSDVRSLTFGEYNPDEKEELVEEIKVEEDSVKEAK